MQPNSIGIPKKYPVLIVHEGVPIDQTVDSLGDVAPNYNSMFDGRKGSIYTRSVLDMGGIYWQNEKSVDRVCYEKVAICNGEAVIVQ